MTEKRHPDYDPAVVETLDKAANRWLSLGAIAKKLEADAEAEIADIQSNLASKLAELSVEAANLDQEITDVIENNRHWLMSGKLKSFTTASAVYSLKEVPDGVEVDDSDKKAIMATARQHGVVRQIANPPAGAWRFSKTKLIEFVKKTSQHFDWFADYLSQTEKGDRINVRPNTGLLVDYNGERLTPPSKSLSRLIRTIKNPANPT